MRIIKGINESRNALSRDVPSENLEASPAVRAKVRDMFGETLTPELAVQKIMEDVRKQGDSALIEYEKLLDGVDVTSLEVRPEEYEDAYRELPGEVVSALQRAGKRIYDFHVYHKQEAGINLDDEGIGRMIKPLKKVGVYVPGGRASYPSTVLMTVLPAKAAGVEDVILCTPPDKSGKVPASTLVAADIAKANRVFRIGGAQAIAAMCFGTESVPKVDKICGPGNVFVTLAKKAAYGVVDIDGLQGPSELVVVADDSASPELCAADLLAQGEHDPAARVVLIVTSNGMAEKVKEEIEKQLKTLERQETLRESVVENGIIAVIGGIEEAIELVDLYAPEHLSLVVRDSSMYISRIHNAGCIFVGRECPPALGDYAAGPSHVLPTSGTARFASPLGIEDFIKSTSVIVLPGRLPEEIGDIACTIAKAEGFDAHCRSVTLRMNRDD